MTEPVPPQSRPAGLRSSRFWTIATAATALVCISTILAWSAIDASFPIAMWKAKVCLRLQSIPSANPEMVEALGIIDAMRTLNWDSLGKRVVGLYVLYGLGIVSTLTLTVLTVRQFTAKRATICCLILAAWGLLYGTRSAVEDWRLQRQIAAVFPRFEQAGLVLRDKWPVESGEIPPGISFYVLPEKYPDVLTLRGADDPYPFHENFGLMITRGQNGIIRFDLAAAWDCCVEYHPNGTVPSAYTSGFGYPSPPVASVFPLKDNWYLVRYAGS